MFRFSLVLVCLAGPLLAACANPDVQAKRAPGIRMPDAGVLYIDRCTSEDDLASRVRTRNYSFRLYEDGTMLIEVNSGPNDRSWIEKQASDFGMQLWDRSGTRRASHNLYYEIAGLQAVSDLAPGARVEGRVSEEKDGVWDEFHFVVEVQTSVSLDHRTLGHITTIPVTSTWLRDGPEPERVVTVFFDTRSGEAVRYVSGITPGSRQICDRAKTDYAVNKPAGITPPRLGVKYRAKCKGSIYSNKPSEEEITFKVPEGDTLRIETVVDERFSWVEKRLADHGIDVADSSKRYYEGLRKQVHEVSGLEGVRKLIPGSRVEGKVYESEAGNWFEYDLEVEVLDRWLINHTTLGQIYTIPVETRRTWMSGGETRKSVSYVDVSTGEVVRYETEASTGHSRSCDLIPQDSISAVR